MNFGSVVKDSTYYLEIYVTDKTGAGKPGLTVTYNIYNSATDASIASGTLTDVGGGIYKKNFIFDTLGQYRIIYNTPLSYENGFETIMVVNQPAEQGEQDLQTDLLKRILGLSQENYRIIDPTYDNRMNLISGTMRIYESAVDCENDENPIAEYEIDADFDKRNHMTAYKVKKI